MPIATSGYLVLIKVPYVELALVVIVHVAFNEALPVGVADCVSGQPQLTS